MEEESDTGRIVKQKGDNDEKINIQEGITCVEDRRAGYVFLYLFSGRE